MRSDTRKLFRKEDDYNSLNRYFDDIYIKGIYPSGLFNLLTFFIVKNLRGGTFLFSEKP